MSKTCYKIIDNYFIARGEEGGEGGCRKKSNAIEKKPIPPHGVEHRLIAAKGRPAPSWSYKKS
jgi:hypothetical protein